MKNFVLRFWNSKAIVLRRKIQAKFVTCFKLQNYVGTTVNLIHKFQINFVLLNTQKNNLENGNVALCGDMSC